MLVSAVRASVRVAGVLRATKATPPVGSYRSFLVAPQARRLGSLSPRAIQTTELRSMLTAKDDHYGGVIVDAEALPSSITDFTSALEESLKEWRVLGKRGIWLKIPTSLATHIAPATTLGFDFHHAEPGHVMLTAWLPEGPCTLPPNASHQVGVGALVLNDRQEILVVQEKNGILKGRGVWKMPTGLVHAGEDVTDAVEREVHEETGVKAKFDSILLMRQAHGFAFGKSDMFVLCALVPEPGQESVSAQESEIEAVQWMPLEDYMAQPFFSGVPLYEQLQSRCAAYAEGKYKGMDAQKLNASLPTSVRKRSDLLIFGDNCDCKSNGIQVDSTL